jgi:hypothetical protein
MQRELDATTEHLPTGDGYPKPDNGPVSLGRNGGPPWMDPSEWAEKVAIYRGQGRSEANIREVAEYLARLGPRWPITAAKRAERAERLGFVNSFTR